MSKEIQIKLMITYLIALYKEKKSMISQINLLFLNKKLPKILHIKFN